MCRLSLGRAVTIMLTLLPGLGREFPSIVVVFARAPSRDGRHTHEHARGRQSIDHDTTAPARMTHAGLPQVCIRATDEVGVCPWIVRDPLNLPADAPVLMTSRLGSYDSRRLWTFICFNRRAAIRLTPRVVYSLIEHQNVVCFKTCSWLGETQYGEPRMKITPVI